MTSITIQAPAKVNLYLKVLSRRKDGYHNILTLFERISLADTIKISKVPKGIIVKSDKVITRDPEKNLCYKAAQAVLKRGKVRTGVKIEIKKRIPIASGLGGGSSDAASTMIGVNRLFSLKLNNKALINIGRRLGADVPFFLLDTPLAMGSGRGDIVEAVKSKFYFWHLVIKAGKKVSTKQIYRAYDGLKSRLTLPDAFDKMGFPSSLLYNDLEEAAVSKDRVTGSIIKSLAHLLGKKAIVSGSGPGLFCLYRSRREAVNAKKVVLKNLPEVSKAGIIFVVRTYSEKL